MSGQGNVTPAEVASSDTLLETSSGSESGGPAKVGLERGAALGRYIVLERLGAGAMGVVYAAYDPELDRKVAVKLLQREGEGSRGRERLMREAQALARVVHPNVVSVHDVGMFGDDVFVAMEYVDGWTLKRWLELETRPWPVVLDVLIQAGAGLGAAHGAGLIHRDFKPENVMVHRDGRVTVVDFGLARGSGESHHDEEVPESARRSSEVTVSSRLTRTGAVVGTPAYMAPEQHVGLSPDARADQFAFCVTAYEALFGVHPFPRASLGALVTALGEGKIAEPRSKDVPRWIRDVLVRGLSPARDDRWPSVAALLQALHRNPARARKRRAFGALAAIGIASSLVAAYRAGAAPDACEEAKSELATVWADPQRYAVSDALSSAGLPYSNDAARRAVEGIDRFAQEWTEARFDACQAHHVRHRESAFLFDRRMACLMEQRAALDATVEVLSGADADVVERIDDLLALLPDPDECSNSDRLLAAVPPPEDSATAARVDEIRRELVRAKVHREAGRYSVGIGIARAALGRAENTAYLPLVADALLVLGLLEGAAGDPSAAAETLRRSYFTALEAADDGVAALAAIAVSSYLGHDLGEREAGLAWGEHAGALVRRSGSDAPLVFQLQNALGTIHYRAESYDAAVAAYEEAASAAAQAFGEDDLRYATALNNLANARTRQEHTDEARRLLERALEIRRRALGDVHPLLASSLNNLAVAMEGAGEYDQALEKYRQALSIWEQTEGSNHPRVGFIYNNVGNIHLLRGQPEVAIQSYEKALPILRDRLGPDHPHVGTIEHNLAEALSDVGRYEEAATLFDDALRIKRARLGADHLSTARTLLGIGELRRSSGDLPGAKAALGEALAVFEKHLPDDHPDVQKARVLLAGHRKSPASQ